ncbi:MAG: hypothetical protein IKR25_12615 [Muribaculaceae bacterium]|nr:hypothetical protein [Muribaculaceae bacterium]
MKKMMTAACAALLLLSGCSSADQFYGAATGASLGGLFGSAIGGITGGRRGHDMGTVVGMAVGAAVGAAATAPKTSDGNYRSSDYYGGYEQDDYRMNNYSSPYADIEVEDIRFSDANRNDCIDAGEHARLSFVVRNRGNQFAYDLAPVITVTGTKQIYLSPTAIISELSPGGAVRYQAEVVATKKLKSGTAGFAISLSDGDHLYTLGSFQLRTRGR